MSTWLTIRVCSRASVTSTGGRAFRLWPTSVSRAILHMNAASPASRKRPWRSRLLCCGKRSRACRTADLRRHGVMHEHTLTGKSYPREFPVGQSVRCAGFVPEWVIFLRDCRAITLVQGNFWAGNVLEIGVEYVLGSMCTIHLRSDCPASPQVRIDAIGTFQNRGAALMNLRFAKAESATRGLWVWIAGSHLSS